MDVGDVRWSLGMMAGSGVIEAGESLTRNASTPGCASRLLSVANTQTSRIGGLFMVINMIGCSMRFISLIGRTLYNGHFDCLFSSNISCFVVGRAAKIQSIWFGNGGVVPAKRALNADLPPRTRTSCVKKARSTYVLVFGRRILS